ncbi:CRISPR-associated protein Cst2 [Caloramator fervidus]|uniref:CRISPR-associated protein Cst2 n=1 Tax=Caloramator fervidus TaxID=29344 RepID=A0A1H5UNQ7_9CLOT|nr:type I-B CRISPR-associated protein Cas7/Cst2/DevR [Caloramator fervidus]SEF76679.1 CRISPR-associated protein Cst2 [Caloramator fervidus]
MSKTATMSIIFQAQSLNYGEGTSNISELKKLTRGNGQQFTVASRQCLRYDIARLGGALFGWNLQVVDKSKGTVQFKDELSIKDSEEMDLFGYMKTKEGEGGKNRSAAVRISFATSLEPYKNDIEFLSNKGLADRINENANLANIEQHLSYYTYTITMDLDKIGVDGEIRLDNETRYNRISQFLDIVKILNREIRGRLENLSPLFVIGGVYDFPNPLFLGRIKLLGVKDSFAIDLEPIKSAMEVSVLDCKVEEKTFVGIVSGIFANEDEIKDLFKDRTLSVNQFFENMKKEIKTYYGV